MDFSFFLSNPLINVGLVSWLVAQGIKTILDAVKHRSFNKQRLAGAGGMPSSHSAVCCSVVLTSYFLYGFQSPVFALAFIVALIVMYDATGVRWAAGLHAKAINQIVEYLDSGDVNDQEKDLNDLIPKLNESLGHRVIEVICGALPGRRTSDLKKGKEQPGQAFSARAAFVGFPRLFRFTYGAIGTPARKRGLPAPHNHPKRIGTHGLPPL